MQNNRSKDFEPFPFQDKAGTKVIVDEIVQKIHINAESVLVWKDEPLALYELARGYHNKPETQGYVLDFGTHRGGSACIMASAVRDSGTPFKPVMTLDLFLYNHRNPSDYNTWFATQDYLESRAAFYKLNLAHEYVCPMMFQDNKFLDFWNLPTRLIFVDTSHTYKQTKLEIEKSIPHVIDDGWLVLHDYRDEHPDVIRAVNEFLDSQKEYDLDVYFAQSYLVCLHVKGRNS